MEIDRRAFLALAGMGACIAAMPRLADAMDGGDPLFLSSAELPEGTHAIQVLTERGDILASFPVSDRGHGAAVHHGTGRVVAFARRPGTFALAFDRQRLATPGTLTAQSGRHFYGHGTFSPDGRLLYATENDFERGEGRIGLYDATDGYRRLGEFPSGGVGPHDMALMPDGRTLVIANGGIETHPDFDREKLNLPTMKPLITLLDRKTGELLEQHEAPASLHQVSLRHMAIATNGDIWVAGQFEGPAWETPPLLARVRQGEGLKLFSAPQRAQISLNNYMASIALSGDETTLAITAPRGNRLTFWNAETGAYLDGVDLTDCGGVAANRSGGFLISSGEGDLVHASRQHPGSSWSRTSVPVRWDNHLTGL
ncbi:DUF1513 domain-containing protein [Coralliovum pocilloporae]|uniref:DUF1513 domain-containing protein n=1 Tax=Coralliovum pocilloporae TaxID=3066369 RepID=UPI003307A93E